MASSAEKKTPSSPRRLLRLTNARRLSQIFFFGLFVICVWLSWTSRIEGYPVSRFLEIDPLIMISSMLATGYVYRYLGWACIVIVLTLLFGRVFCNWICPYGTLHHFTGWLFNNRSPKNRRLANRYRALFYIKYVVLIAFLIMAAMGALQIGLLDPICLLYRSFATAVAPFTDLALSEASSAASGSIDTLWIDQLKFAPGVERRVFIGSFWIGAILFGLVAANAFLPRFFCRVLCPLGALLGLLSCFSLFRINRDAGKCTECGLCLSDCEGACDPDTRLRKSECFSCMNCVDACPEDALSFTLANQDRNVVTPVPDLNRRRLLFAGLAGLAAYPLLKNQGVNTDTNYSPKLIRPPGSVEETRFLERCVKCGQCMNVCPTNVIQPAAFAEAGVEGLWTPVMNYNIGHCQLKCTLCSEVCPTGAIRKITAEEKLGLGEFEEQGPIRLGTAFYDVGRCLPHAMEMPCVVCEEVCPVSPKAIQTHDVEWKDAFGNIVVLNKPFIVPDLCIGCGLCQNECPVQDSPAVYVSAIGESRSQNRRLLLRYRNSGTDNAGAPEEEKET
jgi:polyferredoxin